MAWCQVPCIWFVLKIFEFLQEKYLWSFHVLRWNDLVIVVCEIVWWGSRFVSIKIFSIGLGITSLLKTSIGCTFPVSNSSWKSSSAVKIKSWLVAVNLSHFSIGIGNVVNAMFFLTIGNKFVTRATIFSRLIFFSTAN